jgi:zinc/manganese transport system substrate-binding protein
MTHVGLRRSWTVPVVVGVMAIAGVSLGACGSSSSRTSGAIDAVGAESQYANIISQLGGRDVHVVSILHNPNTDPHTFEINTTVAQEVSSAQLVVQNGLGYDEFMNQLESASPSSSRRVVTVQHVLRLPDATRNPHLWYNVSAIAVVAPVITRDLDALRPHDAAYFAQRLQQFQGRLTVVQNSISDFRATHAGVSAATTEPVADYLLSALGIRLATPSSFETDIMNGVDPSPQDITTEESLLHDRRVSIFCYNEQVVSPLTVSLLTLARQSHVPTVAVYETMPSGYNYQSWMSAELAAISRAVIAHTSTSSL